MPNDSVLSGRVFPTSLHLASSAIVAMVASMVVFQLWYPAPYSSVAGGLNLFILLVGVDVVLGPALTAVIARPSKPMAEFRRDLAFVVAVQLAAFGYGMYTIALARPVFLAFEIDRFRVVTAADIDTPALKDAPSHLRTLPWGGPKLIAAVKPEDPAELIRATELGLAGVDLSMSPRNWRDYNSEQAGRAWSRAASLSLLLARYPETATQIAGIAERAGARPDSLRFLPLSSRHNTWTVVLGDGGARVLGYLPVDGFL